MEFCDKCGALMVPYTQDDGKRVLLCRSCEHTKEIRGELSISQNIEKNLLDREKIRVIEEPKIITCPKCGSKDFVDGECRFCGFGKRWNKQEE
jgi:DNA-directed RNA polymerase subunit M/transcription elongation factor TFIIS